MNNNQMGEFDISVIVPALNEEKNVFLAVNNIIKALGDYNINGEVIVVNDGSSDKTEEVIKGIMSTNANIRLIAHKSPKGIGASYWEGVDLAKGRVITWIPGDNENDPWEIFRYYDLLRHVDIVIPFIFNRDVRPLFRNMLSYLYCSIINISFLVNFNYTNGTVLFRRSILAELAHRSFSFFFQTDILIRSVKKGYLFAEVPYRLGVRKDGISKAVSFPSLMQVIKGYLGLVVDYYFKRQGRGNHHYSDDSLTSQRRGTAS